MAIAQAIPLFGSLVIARLYAPTDFGAFSAWLGLVTLSAVLITGRFEVTLAIVEDGAPRKFAAVATLTTSILSCVVLAIITTAGYFWLPSLRGVAPALFIAFVPASLLTAAAQIWQSWAAADGQYRILSGMRIVQALGVTCTQIVVGFFAPNANALALGHVLGLLVGVSFGVYTMPLAISSLRSFAEFLSDLRSFWLRHRRFPLLSLPADSINSASAQIPMLLIASNYGSEAAGLFALAMRVLGAPIGLLGAAVRDVFKRSAAANYREQGNCRDDYIRTFRVLAAGGALLAIGVMLVSEPLFVLAFGEPWREAGFIAIWLMPMFALRFVASPLSYVFYIADKQHVDLVWQCSLLFMTVTAFTLPAVMETSIKIYSIGYSLLYVAYLWLSYRYSKGNILGN